MARLKRSLAAISCASLVVGLAVVFIQGETAANEWHAFGGDKAFTRYSPLSQVNRDNVSNLKIVWRRPALDAQFTKGYRDLTPSGYLKATPIILQGVLYAPNAVGLIEAFDPGTGKTIWV